MAAGAHPSGHKPAVSLLLGTRRAEQQQRERGEPRARPPVLTRRSLETELRKDGASTRAARARSRAGEAQAGAGGGRGGPGASEVPPLSPPGRRPCRGGAGALEGQTLCRDPWDRHTSCPFLRSLQPPGAAMSTLALAGYGPAWAGGGELNEGHGGPLTTGQGPAGRDLTARSPGAQGRQSLWVSRPLSGPAMGLVPAAPLLILGLSLA